MQKKTKRVNPSRKTSRNPTQKISRPSKKSSALQKKDREMDSFIQMGGERWPIDKDILFRPDRFQYVRKLLKPQGCVFCEAADRHVSIESLCVFKTKYSMVLLNKFPYNSGHLLVIPRRHIGELTDLSQEEHADLHLLLRRAVDALKKVYEPGGINIGMNLGSVAGAGIPDHIHYHLVPRWSGDLNFFPLIANTKVVIESLEQTYAKVSEYFNRVEGSAL